MENCMCGKKVTKIAYMPSNIFFSGGRPVEDAVGVCDFHGEKAKQRGLNVVELKDYKFLETYQKNLSTKQE